MKPETGKQLQPKQSRNRPFGVWTALAGTLIALAAFGCMHSQAWSPGESEGVSYRSRRVTSRERGIVSRLRHSFGQDADAGDDLASMQGERPRLSIGENGMLTPQAEGDGGLCIGPELDPLSMDAPSMPYADERESPLLPARMEGPELTESDGLDTPPPSLDATQELDIPRLEADAVPVARPRARIVDAAERRLDPLAVYARSLQHGHDPSASAEQTYRVGDRLRLSMPFEPESARTVTIKADGRLHYLFGMAVPAAGRTRAELREALLAELRTYFRRPRLHIDAPPPSQ